MGQAIEELARFVAQTQCEDIPEPARLHAKLVLLDTLGVILAGSERPEVREIARASGCDRGLGGDGFRARLANQ